MSRDRIHTEEAKFKKGILDYEDVSDSTKAKWDRYNYDVAEFKVRRNQIRDRDRKRIERLEAES